MNKREYLKLTLDGQADYINKRMKEGKSFNAICSEISLSKGSVSAKLRKYGYKLIDSQYVLKQIVEQQSLNRNEEESLLEGVEVDLQDDKKVIEVTSAPQESETDANQTNEVNLESKPSKIKNGIKKEKKTQLKAKVGRPQKYEKDHLGKNIDKKKFTLEIDKKVYKALKRKKIEENFAINIFVEELLRKSIEEQYFKG